MCAQWVMIAARVLLGPVRVASGLVHRLAAHSSVMAVPGGGIRAGLAGWGGPRAGNAALGSWRHSFSAVTSLIEHGRRELSGVLMAHEGPSFSMRRESPVRLSATQDRSSAPQLGLTSL